MLDKSTNQPRLMPLSETPGQAGDNSWRILARLEYGAAAMRPGRPARRWPAWQGDSWSAGMTTALMALVACAWLLSRDDAVMPRSDGAAGMTTPSPASPAAAAPGLALVQAPQPSPASTPAMITVLARPAAGQAAVIVNQADPARKQDRHEVRPAPPIVQRTAAAHLAPASHKSASAAPTPAHGSVKIPASADADVALLTALVIHANAPLVVAERNRDVVERIDGERTEALLARCKQLGLIEGMLCRSRICSGRWDNDAACRAPSH